MSTQNLFIAAMSAAILVFLTLVGTVFLYFVSPQYLAAINNFDAKWYVLLLVELLLLLIALHISVFFFFPSALRDARSNVLTSRLGLLVSFASPLLLFGMQEVVISDKSWNITFAGASGAAVLSTAISYIALYKFSDRYQELNRPRNRAWASVSS